MDIVIVAGELRLGRGGHRVPALAVLVEVKVFAPLDQVVYFVIKFIIVHHFILLIVEGIVVQGLKLFLEPG